MTSEFWGATTAIENPANIDFAFTECTSVLDIIAPGLPAAGQQQRGRTPVH